jgi:hypothetical protein
MLALAHHAIIRFSALLCGQSEFENYCVLGDDVVIYDDEVAKQYCEVMKSLGVKINISKSLVSKSLIEFAKR